MAYLVKSEAIEALREDEELTKACYEGEETEELIEFCYNSAIRALEELPQYRPESVVREDE